jgi:hypothetical protein
MSLMLFLSALCIAIPLLIAWVKLRIWDAQERRSR